MDPKTPDYIGITLVTALLLLLVYAGILAYQSIDWTILQRLEATPLVVPTPIPVATGSGSPIAPVSSPSTQPTK